MQSSNELIIRQAQLEDQQRWDQYVLSHPLGVPYHQFPWKIAVESAYGYQGHYLLAERNEQIVGVLPLVLFDIPLKGKALISLPYCDVGGELAESEEVARALRREAGNLRSKLNARFLELRGVRVDSTPEELVGAAKVRLLLKLPENSEALMASFKSKLRSQVKKPMKDGLTSRVGGAELAKDFYRVFSQNMRDLGSPVHSKRWIESVLTAYGDRAKIAVIYSPQQEVIAAGILLLHGTMVSNPWASSLREFRKLNPNMLLYWTLLSYATDQGFQVFDFGRSTPGEGTYAFKCQWGASPEPLQWKRISSEGEIELNQSSSGSSSVRKGIETVWSRLPIAVCNSVGPIVRRRISL